MLASCGKQGDILETGFAKPETGPVTPGKTETKEPSQTQTMRALFTEKASRAPILRRRPGESAAVTTTAKPEAVTKTLPPETAEVTAAPVTEAPTTAEAAPTETQAAAPIQTVPAETTAAPAAPAEGGLLFDVPHGSDVEASGRHLFWKTDPDPLHQAIYKTVYAGLEAGETAIDLAPALEGFTFKEDPISLIDKLFFTVKDTDPRFFFYEQPFYYRWKSSEQPDGSITLTSYILDLKIKQGYETKEAREADWQALNAKAWAIADEIAAKSSSLAERYLLLHDYLARYLHYSPENNRSTNNAYDALMRGETMCVGYSLAYQMIANRLGGEVISVYGHVESSDSDDYSGPHNWNVVRLGDTWYNTDLTWDDLAFRASSAADDPDILPMNIYFMRALASIPDHTLYSPNVPATPADYDAFWAKVGSLEELSSVLTRFFADNPPVEGAIQGLRLRLTFPDPNFTDEETNRLIADAYKASGSYHGVRWQSALEHGMFYMQIYPY